MYTCWKVCYTADMDEIGIRMNFDKARLEKLRQTAKEHGFVLVTSSRIGQGNIKAMLEAVVDGDLIIIKPEPNGSQ